MVDEHSTPTDRHWFDALLDSPKLWGAIALITFTASFIPISIAIIWTVLILAWGTSTTAVYTLENVRRGPRRRFITALSSLGICIVLVSYGFWLLTIRGTTSESPQTSFFVPPSRDQKIVEAVDQFMKLIDAAYIQARLGKDISQPIINLSNAALKFDPYITQERDKKELKKKIAEFKDFFIRVSLDRGASSREMTRQDEQYQTMRLSFFNFLDQKLLATSSRTSK